jgi:hypothetical protein
MKYLILSMFLFFSYFACSKEGAIKDKKLTNVKAASTIEPQKAIPCESKEDILKKLEEKKKEAAEKAKGFSLQGGSTGCSVK